MVDNQSTPAHQPAFFWGCSSDTLLVDAKLHELHAETASSNEGEAAIIVDPADDGVAELEEGAGVQDARIRLGLPAANPPSNSPRLEEGADQIEEGTSLLIADGLAFLPPSDYSTDSFLSIFVLKREVFS